MTHRQLNALWPHSGNFHFNSSPKRLRRVSSSNFARIWDSITSRAISFVVPNSSAPGDCPSTVCGLNHEVESMRDAVVLVGLERMRIWASLILFSGLEDKPRDVIVTGAARARMCEKLAEALKMDRPDRFFLVGLFSVLDAIFDRPLEEILKTLPLAPDIAAGLLRYEGQLGSVLRCTMAYERQDWHEAQKCVRLNLERIAQIYQEAITWSLGSLNAFSATRQEGHLIL